MLVKSSFTSFQLSDSETGIEWSQSRFHNFCSITIFFFQSENWNHWGWVWRTCLKRLLTESGRKTSRCWRQKQEQTTTMVVPIKTRRVICSHWLLSKRWWWRSLSGGGPMCGVGWDNWYWENHLSQYLHWTGGHQDGNAGLSCSIVIMIIINIVMIMIIITTNMAIIWTMTMNITMSMMVLMILVKMGTTMKMTTPRWCSKIFDDRQGCCWRRDDDNVDDYDDGVDGDNGDNLDDDHHQNLETGDTAKSLTTHTVAVDDKIHGPGAPKWVDNPGEEDIFI